MEISSDQLEFQQDFGCDLFFTHSPPQNQLFEFDFIGEEEYNNHSMRKAEDSSYQSRMLGIGEERISTQFSEIPDFDPFFNRFASQLSSPLRGPQANDSENPVLGFGLDLQIEPSFTRTEQPYNSPILEPYQEARAEVRRQQTSIRAFDQPINASSGPKLKHELKNANWYKYQATTCSKKQNATQVSSKTDPFLLDLIKKELEKNCDEKCTISSLTKNFPKSYGDDFKNYAKDKYGTYLEKLHDRSSIKVLNETLGNLDREANIRNSNAHSIPPKTIAKWFVEFVESYDLDQIKEGGTHNKLSVSLYQVTAQRLKTVFSEVRRLMDEKGWKTIEIKNLNPEVCIIIHH